MTAAKPSERPDKQADDPFYAAYDRDEPAYGTRPSTELAAMLQQCQPEGEALDLGAGAGRDSLALAAEGLRVTAVDLSRRGLDRIAERAVATGNAARIDTVVSDVRSFAINPDRYRLIVATTVLDHIPMADAVGVWEAMVAGLADEGMLYVEVHTTDDPGSPTGAGAANRAPVSETADQVVNYFPPGALAEFALRTEGLRILRYEERLEWDYTHGPEHQHGKAVLVAVKSKSLIEWYGHPMAFPRR